MKKTLIPGLLLSACASTAPAEHAHTPGEHHGRHHEFGDIDKWVARFDNPERDAWQKPEAVISLLELKETDTVADIGAGTGYFTVRMAPRVKTVLGIDLEPKMVEYLLERAKKAGLDNVEGVVATADDPKLPAGVDMVLVVDTYHHIDDRTAYFTRVLGQLSESGRVAIVDFKPEATIGPPAEMKLSAETVTAEMVAAGFELALRDEKLEHQYVLIFDRK